MVSRVCAAALASVVVLATVGPALAASVPDDFNRICLSSTTPVEATAKARADGYMRAPAEIRAKLRDFPADGEVLWRTGDGEMTVFIAASLKRDMANSPTQTMTGDACLVAAMPAQHDLKPDIEGLLKVGEAQPFGRNTGYIFEQTDKGPVRIDAADKALIAVKTVQGAARVVAVMERPGMSGLMLVIPRVTAR